MTYLEEWAARWNIAPAALASLREMLGVLSVPHAPAESGANEGAVQSRVRLAAARSGMRLFRNNVGAGYVSPDKGQSPQFLRWGLANDSKQLNEVLKSGDLIGWRSQVIQPDDVGKLFARFMSLEVKREGWRYTGTPRERAQQNWAALVASGGGEARFVTSEHEV